MQKRESESVRKPNYPINPLILNRWSPRAMTGETLNDDDIMSLFEAARWAPSSYNNQPWRFIYAKRNTKHWDRFFNLLAEGNKIWAKNAALLVLVISRKNFEALADVCQPSRRRPTQPGHPRRGSRPCRLPVAETWAQ